MNLNELNFDYPESLVAVEPSKDFRCMGVQANEITELNKMDLFSLFQSGDALVINDTKVEKRRVFGENAIEVLFVKPLINNQWEVLFPAKNLKINDLIQLPGSITMKLIAKGLPQLVQLSHEVDENYFNKFGEPALPPYIQKARNFRHSQKEDENWYQTAWAEKSGSCAAPTASLHFTKKDLQDLESKGVQVIKITLHVGLGTFLPIKSPNLETHIMHKEWLRIDSSSIAKIETAKKNHKKVFALGTTVTRALESWKAGIIKPDEGGNICGMTGLFIKPGFSFQVVDVLMTNFHQPQSTLLAMIYAFSSKENVQNAYQWAMDREFQLFSYGNLSVWFKN